MLRELHHVMVWAAFRYSTDPAGGADRRACSTRRWPAEARPLSRAGGRASSRRSSRQQDEAHARALAEKDDAGRGQGRRDRRSCAQQIKAAQAANTLADTHDYSEAETRDLFIDLLLARGRLAARPRTRDREFEVTGMPNAEGTGFVDYVLWGDDGQPLALVEAKRTTQDARGRPAAGQAVRRLPGAAVRPAAGDLLHQRLRALALGRRRRLPAARRCRASTPRTSWSC